jgi:hypothetical protein
MLPPSSGYPQDYMFYKPKDWKTNLEGHHLLDCDAVWTNKCLTDISYELATGKNGRLFFSSKFGR